MDEIRRSKNVILFIDELHTIVGAGSAEGAMDASNIIKPALSRGELQCVGATTLNEYRKYIEKDAALERRFQTVKVEAPTIEEAILILKGLRPKYEAHHKAKLTDEALESAVKLSERYITGRFLPDKAIDVMDEAGARARINAMGLTKGFCFAILIVFISCHKGLNSREGAVGVGRATTEAVVNSSLAILISNFFLTMMLNIVFPAGW